MRISFLYIFSLLSLSCLLLASCDKVSIPLSNNFGNDDPNLTYLTNYKVSLETVQIDSFITSGKQLLTVGFNNDPVFGTIHAGTYLQFDLPATNPLLNQPVTFDSLQIILKPQGSYYGDTLSPIHLQARELAELIQNIPTPASPTVTNNFYNTTTFDTYPGIIGENTVTVFPRRTDSVTIRLADTLGQSLLDKFRTGATEITTQTYFNNFFKGVYIEADSASTNTIYNFSSFTNNTALRLYYTLHSSTAVHLYMDFTYTAANQFSHIGYNHAGSPLAAFTPSLDKQTIGSTQLGNKAFYNASTGYFIKISFPDILNLKTLYPYVRVVSAQLFIPPSPGTFNYPYLLPTPVYGYQTDYYNGLNSLLVGLNGTYQNGDLFIDYQYGQTTGYTYDVTNFINTLLNQNTGGYPAIMLSPGSTLGDQSLGRLIINDQNELQHIQLKLYVLGLSNNSTTTNSTTSY